MLTTLALMFLKPALPASFSASSWLLPVSVPNRMVRLATGSLISGCKTGAAVASPLMFSLPKSPFIYPLNQTFWFWFNSASNSFSLPSCCSVKVYLSIVIMFLISCLPFPLRRKSIIFQIKDQYVLNCCLILQPLTSHFLLNNN